MLQLIKDSLMISGKDFFTVDDVEKALNDNGFDANALDVFDKCADSSDFKEVGYNKIRRKVEYDMSDITLEPVLVLA